MPFVEHKEHQTYFEVHGDGPPVLCPGGWGILTGEGHHKLPRLLREHYTTIVYDHRGLGRSSDTEHPGSTRAYADDAAAVIEAAGLESAHVFGHGGLGACVGQQLAAHHPQRVDRLVLMAGWAGPDVHKRLQAEAAYRVLERLGIEAFEELGVSQIYTPEYVNAHAAQLLGRSGWRDLEAALPAMLKVMRATIDHDARSALPEIEAPTLVVNGELDIVDPPRLGEELVSLIPNSHLLVLHGAPHVTSASPWAPVVLGYALHGFFAAGVPAASSKGQSS